MREIFVPSFRDRVVHHLLTNWLRTKLEKLFIHDNYAGREGRGTLFGIRRAERCMREVTQNYQKPAYVLKLDIASYFRSIPKEDLWEGIQKMYVSSFRASEALAVCDTESRTNTSRSVPYISQEITDLSYRLDSGSQISLLRNGNPCPE
jgi:Reverse transcriptase (RNA-dependent DNA polymerase)